MTIEKAIEAIEGKLVEHKASTTAAATLEVKRLEGILDTLKGKEVKELSDKVVEQGGTIKQMQDEILELKSKRARPGAMGEERPSVQKDIAKLLVEQKDAFEEMAKGGSLGKRFEVKAPGPVLTTSLANGNYIDYLDWRPGMEPTGQTRFRELVRTVASAFDNVKYPVANTPVGQGSFGRQAAEGDVKAQVDRGYTFKDLTLKALAGWIVVSRQSLRNIPFLQTWLPTSLNEQLMDTEDTDFITTLLAAANGNNDTTGAAAVAVEQLIFMIKNSIKAKYNPTGVAIDPDKWASMLITKPQNYSLPNAVTISPAGQVLILGRPVYPVNWLTGGNAIVADWTKAAIVQSEGLSFRQSDNVASQFTQNEVTFLLEETNGLMINRTDAFIKKVLA